MCVCVCCVCCCLMAIMTGWRNQRPLARSLTPRPCRRHWADRIDEQQTRALQQLWQLFQHSSTLRSNEPCFFIFCYSFCQSPTNYRPKYCPLSQLMKHTNGLTIAVSFLARSKRVNFAFKTSLTIEMARYEALFTTQKGYRNCE